jgi:hypothetical protein
MKWIFFQCQWCHKRRRIARRYRLASRYITKYCASSVFLSFPFILFCFLHFLLYHCLFSSYFHLISAVRKNSTVSIQYLAPFTLLILKGFIYSISASCIVWDDRHVSSLSFFSFEVGSHKLFMPRLASNCNPPNFSLPSFWTTSAQHGCTTFSIHI